MCTVKKLFSKLKELDSVFAFKNFSFVLFFQSPETFQKELSFKSVKRLRHCVLALGQLEEGADSVGHAEK